MSQRQRFAIVFVLLVAVAAVAFAMCSSESEPTAYPLADTPRPTAAEYTPTPAPDCIVWGEDPETGSLDVRCKDNTPLNLYVDIEIRTSTATVETKTVDTFVKSSTVPTSTIPITIEVSDMESLGELWVRARWAKSSYDDGIYWQVEKDGKPLALDERGFGLYQELYQKHLPIILVVIQ